MAKTRRFHVSLGHLMFREKKFSLIKPASLTQKRDVFAVMPRFVHYGKNAAFVNEP